MVKVSAGFHIETTDELPIPIKIMNKHHYLQKGSLFRKPNRLY